MTWLMQYRTPDGVTLDARYGSRRDAMNDLAEIREYVAVMTDDELRECLSRQLSTRVRAVAEAEAITRQDRLIGNLYPELWDEGVR